MSAAATAAKSLQLCPTLFDPMDCRLPGSSVHGIFQAGVLEWGAIAFSEVLSRQKQIPPILRMKGDITSHEESKMIAWSITRDLYQ